MNVVMNETGRFIELQGTAEQGDYDFAQLQLMIQLAEKGIAELVIKQKQALGLL
jgi:ribonuclease PH